MLKSLRIQNFKCWRDTGDIRMAPITLFFGCNSSGKSSIGQFLMLLKQTAESSDRRAVLYPGGKGSAVQLGTYRDMVFRHVQEQNIAFSYVWNMPEALRACLVSICNNSNECHGYQLQSVMSQPFTIFPKASAFIQPSKRAFYYPSFLDNSKFV